MLCHVVVESIVHVVDPRFHLVDAIMEVFVEALDLSYLCREFNNAVLNFVEVTQQFFLCLDPTLLGPEQEGKHGGKTRCRQSHHFHFTISSL